MNRRSFLATVGVGPAALLSEQQKPYFFCRQEYFRRDHEGLIPHLDIYGFAAAAVGEAVRQSGDDRLRMYVHRDPLDDDRNGILIQVSTEPTFLYAGENA